MEPRTEHPSRRFTEPSPLVHRAVARRGYRPATVTITQPVERPAINRAETCACHTRTSEGTHA